MATHDCQLEKKCIDLDLIEFMFKNISLYILI